MKIKIIAVCLLSLVAISNALASDKGNVEVKAEATAAVITLEGVIVDSQSGECLAGVKVGIEGTDINGYTDFDGNFVLNNVPVGNHRLSTELISYETKVVEVDIKQESSDCAVKIEMTDMND